MSVKSTKTIKTKRRSQSARPRAKVPGPVARSRNGDAIARRAYELFEARGGEPGRALDDWLRAERDVMGSKDPEQAG